MCLDEIDFNSVCQLQCLNDAYNAFIKLYHAAFEKSFPRHLLGTKSKFIKREPWFTRGLLVSSRNKAKLLTKKLHRPTEANIVKYKTYNKMYNTLKRAMKIRYFHNALDENKHDVKKTWTILRQAIGKINNKSNYPDTFMIHDTPVSDKLQVAESFNIFFSKIGIKTSHNVPHSNKCFSEYMPNSLLNSMFIEPVAPSEVLSIANKLKPKSSYGHDGISSKVLKETITNILEPITHIINRSLDTGIVPQDMKIAKIIPIYKSSDKTLPKNYRPVSLLPAFSKLLEKIMYNKLMSFLDTNNILYKHQYGFRPKHSTVHPIIHLLNHCADSSNKAEPEFTLALFCDLSKAFDVINHDILLKKLNSYGIRGIANQWFKSYLSHRNQFVEIDHHKSNLLPIQCGVPQGSILGPLLYLIYVNDIGNSCTENIVSFADDTTLYMSNSDLSTLFYDANAQINNLFQWFCANRLSLNAKKTKYIIIRPHQKRCNLTGLQISIDSTILNRIGNDCEEKSIKFLGVIFDENLTWKFHIAHVNTKVSRALFAVSQVKHILPKSCLRTLYFSLIQSHFAYGLLAWGSATQSALRSSIVLQKRAIRTINSAKYRSHTDPLFFQSKILKLNDLYEYQATLFVFDSIMNILPFSFHDTLKFNRDIQDSRMSTRQSQLLYEARCYSQFAARLPLFSFPVIWNKQFIAPPSYISRSQFKYRLKENHINAYLNHIKCNNRRCNDCFS